MKFLQKYLHVARQLKPQLTKEAASILAEKYCDLRAQEAAEGIGRVGASDQSRMRRTQPITARTLETLIRLATAHAKARMSKTVTKKDAESAVELVSFVLFKVLTKPIQQFNAFDVTILLISNLRCLSHLVPLSAIHRRYLNLDDFYFYLFVSYILASRTCTT